MSTLVAIAYNDPYRAEEVRTMLRKMHRDYLVDIDDAVVAVKDEKGAVSGGFWGALIGLLFMAPLLGMAVGAAAGAISGALTDVGINDAFMKELATTLKPKSSALFALVKTASPDRVLDELKGTGGKILRSSLSHEDEARLQKAIGAVKAA